VEGAVIRPVSGPALKKGLQNLQAYGSSSDFQQSPRHVFGPVMQETIPSTVKCRRSPSFSAVRSGDAAGLCGGGVGLRKAGEIVLSLKQKGSLGHFSQVDGKR